MIPTTEQIASQLQKLLPPGALARGSLAVIGRLLFGSADEIARLYARLMALLEEAHPGSTTELLDDWEAEYDLPDPCIENPQTIEERRAAILAKLNYVGSQPVAFFYQLAASIGITINITEHHSFEIGRDGMGDFIGPDEWNFVWEVIASDDVEQGLRNVMECNFKNLKPAHTLPLFTYES
jgi:Uncharacterized protein conserved in bacteria